MEEIWKPVLGYEGLYEVSNFGRVKSIFYKRQGKEIILKPCFARDYLTVMLCKNKTKKHHSLHRLVWEAFTGPIPEGMQVNHINEDKTDNRLENLNLMTCKENINWGTGIKRQSASRSVPIVQYDKNGNYIKQWASATEVQKQLGFNQRNISANCRNKRKTAYGFVWRYAV